MDDLQAVIIITILSYLIEFLNINLDISLINLILFINMIGIYIIIKKIQFKIEIKYNNDRERIP